MQSIDVMQSNRLKGLQSNRSMCRSGGRCAARTCDIRPPSDSPPQVGLIPARSAWVARSQTADVSTSGPLCNAERVSRGGLNASALYVGGTIGRHCVRRHGRQDRTRSPTPERIGAPVRRSKARSEPLPDPRARVVSARLLWLRIVQSKPALNDRTGGGALSDDFPDICRDFPPNLCYNPTMQHPLDGTRTPTRSVPPDSGASVTVERAPSGRVRVLIEMAPVECLTQ